MSRVRFIAPPEYVPANRSTCPECRTPIGGCFIPHCPPRFAVAEIHSGSHCQSGRPLRIALPPVGGWLRGTK